MTDDLRDLPAWVPTFLARLAASGMVTKAARETGVATHAAYTLRKANGQFAELWDEALEQAYDDMEDEMQRRAFRGYEEPLYYQGAEVGRVTKYSDKLAMYLMSGYRKRKFAQRSELSGPDGEPLQVDEVKRAGRVAQLLGLARARKDVEDLT